MPSNKWYYENMNKWSHESRGNYPFINFQATKISKRCVFVLATWPWRLPGEWPEACGSLTVVGAGTMHGFGTDPIRIRQFDWWRAGIRSTNLHIVVECHINLTAFTMNTCLNRNFDTNMYNFSSHQITIRHTILNSSDSRIASINIIVLRKTILTLGSWT